MSRIDALIAKFAPAGVEFRRVGDVAQVGTGSSDRKDATDDGPYPFYVRSKDVMRIGSYEFEEDAIVIPGEGGVGSIFHFVSGKYALHQRAYRISFRVSDLDPKYAYYYFSVHFKKFILQKAVSATVTSIRKPMITDFRIPVPPLEVQREIVRVLDQFTQLEAELEAELETRRRQYEHYRRLLLAVPDDAAWTTLGDATENHDRKRKPVTRADRQDGEYPYYGANGIQDYVHDFIFEGTFLLVGEDGSVKRSDGTPVLNWAEGQIWVNNHAHVLTARDDRFSLRYLLHFLSTVDISAFVTGSTQPKLNQKNLNQIQVPLLARDGQERIVVALDKFDALVNDLSFGLPAEIAARRQQYEYYRDKLLAFKEATA